jgi:hypothetical protein
MQLPVMQTILRQSIFGTWQQMTVLPYTKEATTRREEL